MARLYADENFLLPVEDALRVLGHDVVTFMRMGKEIKATQMMLFCEMQRGIIAAY